MSYQGKKNIPRITVSLALGKLWSASNLLWHRTSKEFFFKEGEEEGPNSHLPSPVTKEGDRGSRSRSHRIMSLMICKTLK